jgi:hypothetical protein
MSPPPTYRPALRALVLGAAAAVTRAITLVVVAASTSSDEARALDLDDAALVLAFANPIGTVLALAGVAYAAIAAHRREWGVTLVLAWIASVTAAFYVPELFVYAVF